jgi:VIT1/CCC1 family predicted Fe2+/Mn2+ transporter
MKGKHTCRTRVVSAKKRPRCRGLKVDRFVCALADAASYFFFFAAAFFFGAAFFLVAFFIVDSPNRICDRKKNRSVIHI